MAGGVCAALPARAAGGGAACRPTGYQQAAGRLHGAGRCGSAGLRRGGGQYGPVCHPVPRGTLRELPGLGRVGGPAAADLCRCVAAELRRAGVQRLRPAAPKTGQLTAGGRCAAGVSVAAHLAVPVCARVALPYALHAAGAERCRRTAAGCGADQNFSCAGSALRAYALRGGDGCVPALHRTGTAPDPV